MCLSDAGNGLRGTDFVSTWPSGIHVGASWNKALTRRRGSGMGGEFKTKGVNVLLGPVVGPAGRVVLGGRNWEGKISFPQQRSRDQSLNLTGFSVDPYLSGVLVSETVTAVQAAGVITSTKVGSPNQYLAFFYTTLVPRCFPCWSLLRTFIIDLANIQRSIILRMSKRRTETPLGIFSRCRPTLMIGPCMSSIYGKS